MRTILMIFFAYLLTACGGASVPEQKDEPTSPEKPTTPSTKPPAEHKISSNTSWFLQLQGTIDLTKPVELYEVDLFDTAQADITGLKNRGVQVICYFSAGSYENWRDDKNAFHSADFGKDLDGWAGENLLDIRSENVRTIMKKRIEIAKEKGCTGVDPDNVDGYSNNTGFPLTARDQLNYNRFLADTAHKNNLVIALKNDLNQIQELEPYFDLSVNEQCQFYDECHLLKPFKDSNKLIINIEYEDSFLNSETNKAQLCSTAINNGLKTKVLNLDLSGVERFSCF
ncbi:MAG: hypothetical protein RL217_703 [Pseudomonadota bacterium]|jgi:hypothetical protein